MFAPVQVDRLGLKGLQTKYFSELTAGNYDLKYFENRLRVGQMRHRIRTRSGVVPGPV